ncbi:MAG TPA: hypothetical protein VG347_04580 [Verrucomicrobiae bacterium]|nr:hypothetical protein [Verrucomicrobiae bacterium]
MSSTAQRIIRCPDLAREQGWKLVEWCAAQRGEEFSIRFMHSGGEPSAAQERLTGILAPFYCGCLDRENLTTPGGRPTRRPTGIWRLNPESMAVLHAHISDEIFATPSYSTAGWFEDFTIYRHKKIMLGVCSHEGALVLGLTEQEHLVALNNI